MIGVTMAHPEGVTLDTAGKYCPENVCVIPGFVFAENARRWSVAVPAEISQRTALLNDPWIAEHYADERLCVCLLPVSYETPTGDYRLFAGIELNRNVPITGNNHGVVYRAGTDGSFTLLTVYGKVSAEKTVNRFYVDADGNFGVCSGLCAGTYTVMAWLT